MPPICPPATVQLELISPMGAKPALHTLKRDDTGLYKSEAGPIEITDGRAILRFFSGESLLLANSGVVVGNGPWIFVEFWIEDPGDGRRPCPGFTYFNGSEEERLVVESEPQLELVDSR
jgi:hypothetical protein